MSDNREPSVRFRLRHQERSCANCRYFRIHKTGTAVSECLLLGRSLGIGADKFDSSQLVSWARGQLCDGWKKRPSTWNIYSEGVDKSPYWVDPYISRETAQRLRKEQPNDPKA